MDSHNPTPPPLRLLERPVRRPASAGRAPRPQSPVETAWWLRWLGLRVARKD